MKRLIVLAFIAACGSCLATASDIRRVEVKIDANEAIQRNNMEILREELKFVITTQVRKTCTISTPVKKYEIPGITALECMIIARTLQGIMNDMGNQDSNRKEEPRLKSHTASERI